MRVVLARPVAPGLRMDAGHPAWGHHRVRRVVPGRPSQPWVYAKVGACSPGIEEGRGSELLLLSPGEEPLHVELLAMVAHCHRDPRHRLGRTHRPHRVR
jgi:hypothetical protein